METPLSILFRYWKYKDFRPLQQEIIHSVLAETDTLALLPTGGGKSVCFQVPALMRDGVCIVITPLIALMKDQVEQLKKKSIQAVAIHSGMSRGEIDVLLDNCIYGSVKFLYVSPERLQTELFTERAKRMKIALIAVDEAHCISQWGYDFRPPYLQIASLRKLSPNTPVIALTATATQQVRDDITDKLEFRKPFQVFQKTFARDNLSFVVRKTENKEKKLLEILQKVKGPAIIYVRSRKATQQIAEWLSHRTISASYYHAGLAFEERTKRQDEWIHNKSRVMVATNAFGMGIDKPDVRLVIHLDLPENLESYYQEAGRGGRDGVRAYAVILYQDADVLNLQFKTEQSQPSPDFLKKIYQALANYYQLAIGSSEGESYDFDIFNFCDRFNFHASEVYSALKKLEEEGLIQFNESFYSPSQLHIVMNHHELYAFQVAHARFDPMIKMMLRLYGGELYSGFVKISESYLARAMKTDDAEIVSVLRHLHEMKVVMYEPVKDKPQITFVLARQHADNLPLNYKRLAERKELILGKMKAMVDYTMHTHRCRMQVIQEYFDEHTDKQCNICDVCIEKRKRENLSNFETLKKEVMYVIKQHTLTVEELEERVSPQDSELFIDVVRDMVEEGKLEYDAVWRLRVPE